MEDQKFQQKIGIIKNLIPKFDNIIIVGGMANNILSHKGNNIGNSIKEENCETTVKEIFETSKNYSCEIFFPEDVFVSKSMDGKSKIKELNQIEDNDLILDIGPKTVDKIKKIIEISETVLWNGPADILRIRIFCKWKLRNCKSNHQKNKQDTITQL